MNPEVVFWEPINSRGNNTARLQQARVSWSEQVSSIEKAAHVFDEQLKAIKFAASLCKINLHVWPDKRVAKHSKFNVAHWFYKPTVENW